MPTTPGIRWKKDGNVFTKSIMRKDVSFVQVQWLYFLQATSPILMKPDGTRHIIEHEYFHGEHQFEGLRKFL